MGKILCEKMQGKGQTDECFLRMKAVKRYLGLQKRKNIVFLFKMVDRAILGAGMQGRVLFKMLFLERNLGAVLAHFPNGNTRHEIWKCLRKFAEWLKRQGKLSKDYRFPEARTFGITGNTVSGNVYLANFDPLLHVRGELMQFASLLSMELRIRSFQMVGIRYSDIDHEKWTIAIENKWKRLTRKLQAFIISHPGMFDKRGNRPIFSCNQRRICTKTLGSWFQNALVDEFKGKIKLKNLTVRVTKDMNQGEFKFESMGD